MIITKQIVIEAQIGAAIRCRRLKMKGSLHKKENWKTSGTELGVGNVGVEAV